MERIRQIMLAVGVFATATIAGWGLAAAIDVDHRIIVPLVNLLCAAALFGFAEVLGPRRRPRGDSAEGTEQES